MRGYAGLCGAMRGYAGRWCSWGCVWSQKTMPKAKWPFGLRKGVWLQKKQLAVKMGLWKRIWSWNRGRKNGIGRENGIVNMDMVVKMILAVKWSLWKRQLLNSRVLRMHGSRQAYLAKRLVLQKVWPQTFCNNNSDNYIYILITYTVIIWIFAGGFPSPSQYIPW